MVGRVCLWRCVCLSASVSVGLSGRSGASLEVCLSVCVCECRVEQLVGCVSGGASVWSASL